MSSISVELPIIAEDEYGKPQATRKIMNYLSMLSDQLKFNQTHISMDDFEADALALLESIDQRLENIETILRNNNLT